MIVEILGAKLLAPYFGTSHFVWTAQIAVTMVALAAGYYAGRRLVGSSARLGRLYGAIVIAAAYLAVAVDLREWVAYLFLMLPLAAGSLLASVFLAAHAEEHEVSGLGLPSLIGLFKENHRLRVFLVEEPPRLKKVRG